MVPAIIISLIIIICIIVGILADKNLEKLEQEDKANESMPIQKDGFFKTLFLSIGAIFSFILSALGALFIGIFDVLTFPFRFIKTNFAAGNTFTAIFTIIACLFFVTLIIAAML